MGGALPQIAQLFRDMGEAIKANSASSALGQHGNGRSGRSRSCRVERGSDHL